MSPERAWIETEIEIEFLLFVDETAKSKER